MPFPLFTVLSGLDKSYQSRWQSQFVKPGRAFLESIWRRSQIQENMRQSGWNSPVDQRRRIIQVIDGYDVIQSADGHYDLVITDCYMWLCTSLPSDEMTAYISKITDALKVGGWVKTGKTQHLNRLAFDMELHDRHPEDDKANRFLGDDYKTLEITLKSANFPADQIKTESPWAVYDSGMRHPGKRSTKAQVSTDSSVITPYLPFQLELGGGASLELGIPPLNYFHTTYSLYDNADLFAFGETDDLLPRVLTDPAKFYITEAAIPYRQALLAKPNSFYQILPRLRDQGALVGPVITNNFDGICSLVGLEEFYVRKYDETHIVPQIEFDEKAKSLLVVGSHADRRKIQQAARQQGLKVIYVDPEHYFDHAGKTVDYPLEELHTEDILIPLAASLFAEHLERDLNYYPGQVSG